jgi:2-polyprenyl-3-methyl-5-hydroxy-6-metoxy-1,4-benzoquinol methylase
LIHQKVCIEDFLFSVQEKIVKKKSYLINIFNIYANEARFARNLIEEDLALLSDSSSILEVGAGSLILSCQLVREGYHVTSIEPVGNGFGHFADLQNIVLEVAKLNRCIPAISRKKIEKITNKDEFDFVFSINVMEHIDDINQAILAIARALKNGAYYRFICPNYLFPYEPHFDMPILFTKNITEKLLSRYIKHNRDLVDPIGIWKSLNWITVLSIKRACKNIKYVNVSFRRDLLMKMIVRVENDSSFSLRRSVLINWILIGVIASKLLFLTRYIPAVMQPVIDCKIHKKGV